MIVAQAVIAVAYLILARVVHSCFTNSLASVLWPSSGLALAALLLGGRRYAWGVFLGALLAHVIADNSLWTAVMIAFGNTLEALLGAWLLTRSGKFDVNLQQPSDYVRLLLLGGFAAGLIGTAVGPGVLLIAGVFTPGNYLGQSLHWWMGDVLGVGLIAPLILVWRQLPDDWLGWKRLVEILSLFSMTFLAGQVIFLGWFQDTLGLVGKSLFLMFLFITWAAVRLGRHGVLLVLVMIAVQALSGAYNHVGGFAQDMVRTQLLNFWLYIVTLSVVGMLLASYISVEKRDKQALRKQEEFFRQIAENVDEFIAVFNLEGKRVYNSPSYHRLFGDMSALHEADAFAEVHPDDRERVRQMFSETVMNGIGMRTECRFLLPNGVTRIMEAKGGLTSDRYSPERRVLLVSHDITERKQADENIRNLAFYDPLTHLPNRRLLNDRLVQVMAASRRNGCYAAVIFLDLDNFKPINDDHGHELGDALLVEVAKRISHCVRKVDTVARFGGDEFVVLLGELDKDKAISATEALHIAEKIGAALAEPYVLQQDAVEHRCSASIGCVLFFDHESGQEDLFRWADMAMYQAKRNGRKQICFPDKCVAIRSDSSIEPSLCIAHACPYQPARKIPVA